MNYRWRENQLLCTWYKWGWKIVKLSLFWNSPPWAASSKCWGRRSGWKIRRKSALCSLYMYIIIHHLRSFVSAESLSASIVKFLCHSLPSNQWAAMCKSIFSKCNNIWTCSASSSAWNSNIWIQFTLSPCFESIVKFNWPFSHNAPFSEDIVRFYLIDYIGIDVKVLPSEISEKPQSSSTDSALKTL